MNVAALDDTAPDAASIRRDRLRALSRSRTFVIGAAIVLFWIACALFGGMGASSYR